MVATTNSPHYSRLQSLPSSSQSQSADPMVSSSTAKARFYDAVGRSNRRNMGLFVDTATELEVEEDDTPKSTTRDGDGRAAPTSTTHLEEQQEELSPSDKTRHLVESFRRRGESFGESSVNSITTASGKNTPTASDRSTPLSSAGRTPTAVPRCKPIARPMSPVSQGFLGTLQTERQRTEERIQVIKKLRHLKERQSKGQSANQESSEFVSFREDRFVTFNDIPGPTKIGTSMKNEGSMQGQAQFPTHQTVVSEKNATPSIVVPQATARRRQISPGPTWNSSLHRAIAKPIESGAIKHFEDLYSSPKGVFPAIHSINHANFKNIEKQGEADDIDQNIKETLTYGQMLRAASREAADMIGKRPTLFHRPPTSPKRSVVHMDEIMPPTTSSKTFGVKSLGRVDSAQSRDKTSPSLLQHDARETKTIPQTLGVKSVPDNNVSQSRDDASSTVLKQNSQKVTPILQKLGLAASNSDEAQTRHETSPASIEPEFETLEGRDPPTILQTDPPTILGVRSIHNNEATQPRDEISPPLVLQDSLTFDHRESPSNETPTDNKTVQEDLRDSPCPLSRFSDQEKEALAERSRANNFLVELAKAKSEILDLQQRLTAADNASQAYKKDLMKARQVKSPFWKRVVKKKDHKLYGDLGSQTANDNEDLVSQLLNVIHTLPICEEISLRINLVNGESGWDIISARAEKLN